MCAKRTRQGGPFLVESGALDKRNALRGEVTAVSELRGDKVRTGSKQRCSTVCPMAFKKAAAGDGGGDDDDCAADIASTTSEPCSVRQTEQNSMVGNLTPSVHIAPAVERPDPLDNNVRTVWVFVPTSTHSYNCGQDGDS